MTDTTTTHSTEPDFGALGWQDRDPNEPEVAALRDHLDAHNGIHGLEIVEPQDVEAAVRIFRRDGFVVIGNALDAEQTAFLRAGVREVAAEIVAADDDTKSGNRGSHRYSFGGASSG